MSNRTLSGSEGFMRGNSTGGPGPDWMGHSEDDSILPELFQTNWDRFPLEELEMPDKTPTTVRKWFEVIAIELVVREVYLQLYSRSDLRRTHNPTNDLQDILATYDLLENVEGELRVRMWSKNNRHIGWFDYITNPGRVCGNSPITDYKEDETDIIEKFDSFLSDLWGEI